MIIRRDGEGISKTDLGALLEGRVLKSAISSRYESNFTRLWSNSAARTCGTVDVRDIL